jgi:hypothetical protein
MKIIMVAFSLLVASACTQGKKEKKSVSVVIAKDSLQYGQTNDYFRVDPPYFLQKDILLDTVEYMRKDSSAEVAIIVPNKTSENAIIYRWIDSLRRIVMRKYREAPEVKDAPKEIYRQGFSVEPIHLFQSDKFMSYVIRSENGNGSTGSYFDTYIMNVDLKRNKQIHFEDFFVLKTHDDSLYLAEVTSRAIGYGNTFKENEYQKMFYLRDNFAFDDDNVYFYFKRYDVVASHGPIGAVRKKFLSSYINPKYQ